MCRSKTYPKNKVHAKYEVNISNSVVLTPYPYLSIIRRFGDGFKSFQLGILKYVQRGDFLQKTRSLFQKLKQLLATHKKPYFGLYKGKREYSRGEWGESVGRGVCKLKIYPKTKVPAKYHVHISTSVVSTPYPYSSMILCL